MGAEDANYIKPRSNFFFEVLAHFNKLREAYQENVKEDYLKDSSLASK